MGTVELMRTVWGEVLQWALDLSCTTSLSCLGVWQSCGVLSCCCSSEELNVVSVCVLALVNYFLFIVCEVLLWFDSMRVTEPMMTQNRIEIFSLNSEDSSLFLNLRFSLGQWNSQSGLIWQKPKTVGLCHHRHQPCALGGVGGAVGPPTHVEGHSVCPSKLTPRSSINQGSWGGFQSLQGLSYVLKLKGDWKIVKNGEKNPTCHGLIPVRDKSWWLLGFWSRRQKEMDGAVSIFKRTYSSCS